MLSFGVDDSPARLPCDNEPTGAILAAREERAPQALSVRPKMPLANNRKSGFTRLPRRISAHSPGEKTRSMLLGLGMGARSTMRLVFNALQRHPTVLLRSGTCSVPQVGAMVAAQPEPKATAKQEEHMFIDASYMSTRMLGESVLMRPCFTPSTFRTMLAPYASTETLVFCWPCYCSRLPIHRCRVPGGHR